MLTRRPTLTHALTFGRGTGTGTYAGGGGGGGGDDCIGTHTAETS